MRKTILTQISQMTPTRRWAVGRAALSLSVLALFFGALLVEYWPDFISIIIRTFNIARAAGVESIPSQYFDVRNGSSASERQVHEMVDRLEADYQAISAYLGVTPTEKIDLLVMNGIGPALIEEDQLLVHYDNGKMMDEIAPLYLVFLISDTPLDLGSPLALPGGYAMHVMEAAGIKDSLLSQSLDSWTVLLRRNGGYIPLEKAWETGLPYDLDGAYDLLRSILESGSFLQWFSAEYGQDAAMQLAQGEPVDSLTGKSIIENEQAWLAVVENRPLDPKPCKNVLPQDSLFRLFCEKIDGSAK